MLIFIFQAHSSLGGDYNNAGNAEDLFHIMFHQYQHTD